jgi:galactokinase
MFMPSMTELKSALKDDRAKSVFEKLYGSEMVGAQRLRYDSLLDRFGLSFPGFTDVGLFSTPGRTEVCGNHTDHNGGRVLAGAVNLDAVAAASKTDDDTIIIASEGYPEDTVDLRNLSPLDAEKHTSAALIRGIAARLSELGYTIGGFRAVTTSSVLKGSGLSSSAAF